MKSLILVADKNHENKFMSRENKGVRELESVIKHIVERLRVLIDTIDNPIQSISYKISNFTIPHILTKPDTELLLSGYMSENLMPESIRGMYM
jgi:hypothetical protein